jgi:hypothetical protein
MEETMTKERITTNGLLSILSDVPKGMTVRQCLNQISNRCFTEKNTTTAEIRSLLQASSFVTEIPSTEMHGSIPTAKFKLRTYVPASPEGKALAKAIRQGCRELNG